MIGRRARPLCRDPSHAADIDQKRDQLPGPRRQLSRPRQDRGIIGEQLRVVLADHPGAGAGRGDDIVIAGERVDDLSSRSLSHRRGRPNYRPAGRSRSAPAALRPCSRPASSNRTAANPTVGRNRSTRQVTNSPTRARRSAICGHSHCEACRKLGAAPAPNQCPGSWRRGGGQSLHIGGCQATGIRLGWTTAN